MILEGIFILLFGIVDFVISLFPNMNIVGSDGYTGMAKMIGYALTWFPIDLWIALISNILFWLGIQFGWIVIEWVYKKIPGID